MTRSFLDGRAFGFEKTVIFTIHTPVGGTKIRFRFSNRFGESAYEIGEMTVRAGRRSFRVTRNGARAFYIPTGGAVYSDEVSVNVPAGSDIEIRLYYKNAVIDCNMIEKDATLLDGNQTGAERYDYRTPRLAQAIGAYNAIPALESVELFSEKEPKMIAAFGDSITALSLWTGPLARRLEKAYGDEFILLNSGISGNCLLYEPPGLLGQVYGEAGTKRFAEDVLEIPNLHAVIIGIGVNDASYYTKKTSNIINLENYRTAITEMTEVLHKMGIRVILQTITPRLGVARYIGIYTREMEEQRLLFNDWIRSAGLFDYMFDAEAVVSEERADGVYFREDLQRGDHLHPNEKGGQMLADAIDLAMLTGESEKISRR